MPNLALLFTVFMLPGVCMLATSVIVAWLEESKRSLIS